MKSIVYTPNYLGQEPIDLRSFEEPYQMALFSHLVYGNLSDSDSTRLMPASPVENKDGILVFKILNDSVSQALEKCEEGSESYKIRSKTLLAAKKIISVVSDSPRIVDLYDSSYSKRNPFSEYIYDNKTGLTNVVKLPVGLRCFGKRAFELNKSIYGYLVESVDNIQTEGERRFNDHDILSNNFPGLNIEQGELNHFEQTVLDYIYAGGDSPDFLSAQQVDQLINLVGGGTLLNALMKPTEVPEDGVEAKILVLAKRVEKRLGRSAFRITSLGRTAWGVHSIRLRAGDTIPRVTLPKPGI